MTCPSRSRGARTTRRTPRPGTSAGGHAAAAALALTPVLLALTPAVIALALGKLPAA